MNSESPEQSRGLSAPVKHKSEMILCQRYEHVQENLEEEAKVASSPRPDGLRSLAFTLASSLRKEALSHESMNPGFESLEQKKIVFRIPLPQLFLGWRL